MTAKVNSPRRASLVLTLAVTLLSLLVLTPRTLRASHYPLNAIDIASSDETYALYKAGVTDTKSLLAAAGKSGARGSLATKTKISAKRLRALAALCDLLQVKGVGPTVARLFQACKVANLRALKAKKPGDAAALSACMAQENRERPITDLTPSADFVQGWIVAAQAIESLVD
jgi:hypothetical protein